MENKLARGRNYKCVKGCYAWDPEEDIAVRIMTDTVVEFNRYKVRVGTDMLHITYCDDIVDCIFKDKYDKPHVEIFVGDFLTHFKEV